LGVGRDLTDYPVPAPLPWAENLPFDQVAQSPIQPGLEHFQGGGIHSFSGQTLSVLHHPHSKKYLPLQLI